MPSVTITIPLTRAQQIDRIFLCGLITRQVITEEAIDTALDQRAAYPDEPTLSDILLATGVISLEERRRFTASIQYILQVESTGNTERQIQDILARLLSKVLPFIENSRCHAWLGGEEYPNPNDSFMTTAVNPVQDIQLLRPLYSGGLGQVWLAHDERLKRDVAVKVILPRIRNDEAAQRRFRKESQISAQLQHSNIIPVYQGGEFDLLGNDFDNPGKSPEESGANPFYTTRIVSGQSLTKYAERIHSRWHGRIPHGDLNNLLAIFLKICDAVAYAHSRGVVHCDLKPDNVVVGEFGEVFVLDWGLANVLAADCADYSHLRVESSGIRSNASEEMIIGSLPYMSPEQLRGQHARVDRSSDVYALGGILFHLLTGGDPYQPQVKETAKDFLTRLTPLPLPSAHTRKRWIPPALDAICQMALARRKEERYNNASLLADDVRRWIGFEPVRAKAEGTFERLARFSLRNRFLTLSMMATMVLGTLLAMVFFTHYLTIAEARSKFEVRKMFDQTRAAQRYLQTNIQWLDDEATSLGETPPVRNFIQAAARDPEKVDKQLRNDFERVLSTLLRGANDTGRIDAYVQSGRIVRVGQFVRYAHGADIDINSQVVVPDLAHQNMVSFALRTPKGRSYLGPMSFQNSVDNGDGAVEATVELFSPVYSDSGPIGALEFELSFTAILDQLADQIRSPGQILTVFDTNGSVLLQRSDSPIGPVDSNWTSHSTAVRYLLDVDSTSPITIPIPGRPDRLLVVGKLTPFSQRVTQSMGIALEVSRQELGWDSPSTHLLVPLVILAVATVLLTIFVFLGRLLIFARDRG